MRPCEGVPAKAQLIHLVGPEPKLDAIEADILNLETTLEAAPAADDGFAAFETALPVDADDGLISFDATPDDEGFAAFEAAHPPTDPKLADALFRRYVEPFSQ